MSYDSINKKNFTLAYFQNILINHLFFNETISFYSILIFETYGNNVVLNMNLMNSTLGCKILQGKMLFLNVLLVCQSSFHESKYI